MSDPGRQQFLWPTPGLPRDPDNAGAFKPPAPGQADPVAEPFCLVYMRVEEVDHLHLAKSTRRVYRRVPAGGAGGADAAGGVDGWTEENVNP